MMMMMLTAAATAETAAAGDVVFERDVGPVLEMLVEGV